MWLLTQSSCSGASEPSTTPAHIADAHWRTIAIGDDDLAQRIYLQQLTVGTDLVSLLRALQGADRLLNRVAADRVGNIVHSDPAGRQR